MRINLLFLLLLSLKGLASETIHFANLTIPEALSLAKQQNKAVLLYFHFDGCAPCAKMEKEVFTDYNVAEYYNDNFISINVNTTPATGKEIANAYGVRINPAFIFLDSSGKELHRTIGSSDADGFLQKGKDALSATSSLAHYKRRYSDGESSPEFLYNYIYLLRDAKELTPEVISRYLKTQPDDALASEKNIRLIYEFCFHNYKPIMQPGSREYDFMADNVDLFSHYFEKEQVEARLCIIAIESANRIIESQNDMLFSKLIRILDKYKTYDKYEFKEMYGGVTYFVANNGLLNFQKIKYYHKKGNDKSYDLALNEYLGENGTNMRALDRLAWFYYNNYSDSPNLDKAVSWIRKSIDLESGYLNNKTYAYLLYKTGNKEKAMEKALEAIRLAERDGYSYQEVTDLLEKINKER